MPLKKPYTFYFCRNCDLDFLVTEKLHHKKVFCPKCAENMFIDVVKTVWLERPLNYKRPWSEEEDSVILHGVELGCSYQEISESLRSRSAQAVRRRLQRLRKGEGIENR